MSAREVLDQIEQRATEAERHVSLCGPCDGGLPMACTCPKDDPRDAIAGLVTVARSQNAALRAVLDWSPCQGADELHADHMRVCVPFFEARDALITEGLGADV